MSKKHRHKHDFIKDQGYYNIVTPEEIIILIAVILIFGRDNYNYEHTYYMQQKGKRENINKGTFEEPELNEKVGFSKENIETANLSDVKDALYDSVQTAQENYSPENAMTIHSKVKVYSSKTIQSDLIDNIKDYISSKAAVCRVPVIISKPKIKIMLEALVSFPEPVFKIEDIDKTITLTECKLVAGSDILFIKGLINEKIEYAAAEYVENSTVRGSVKEVIFNLPFKCTAKVFFNFPPKNVEANSTIAPENVYCRSNTDFHELNNSSCEVLKDNISAEVDSVKIFETDIKEKITLLDNSSCEAYTFEKVRKKTVVVLELNLVQNQIIFSSFEGEG